MLTLAINTASSKTSIALLDDTKVLGEKTWLSNNDEAEKLMPAIKSLLGDADYHQLNRILVVNGPGSFTGLRIGVATANTIAHLVSCQLFAISTFDYWHLALQEKPGLALLVYAGSGGVYFQGKPVDLPDLPPLLKAQNVTQLFGDITDAQKETIKDYEFLQVDQTFGQIISQVDFSALKPQTIVKPLYVKKPSITISTKSLF